MRKYIIATFVVAVGGLLAGTASANHTWGPYHWFRTANPFTVTAGDNVSSAWDSYLAAAASDWSLSSVLDVAVLPGMASAKTCKPKVGRVEVCNSKYGRNGWLGIASIWISGEHIAQGTVKMNDTYFSTRTYNTPAWRSLVVCQEIGHTFGLDHQDENFTNANLGTCMDYTNDPSANQHPDLHDYEMLETIYAHLDGTSATVQSTVQNGNDIDTNNEKEWGKELKRSKDGRTSLFKRDLGKGKSVFTHVFWAEPRR